MSSGWAPEEAVGIDVNQEIHHQPAAVAARSLTLMKCVCKRLFIKQKITCLDCFSGETAPPTGSRVTNLDGANVGCMVELRRAKASSLCMKLLELVFTGGLFSKPTHCLAEFNLGCCIVGVVKAKGFESLTTLPISLEALQCLGLCETELSPWSCRWQPPTQS